MVCFPRSELKQDVLYNTFRFREVTIAFSKLRQCALRVEDIQAKQMVQRGLITQAQLTAYTARVLEAFAHVEEFDALAPQDIYRKVDALRFAVFGAEALAANAALLAKEGTDFVPAIDQSHKKRQLIAQNERLTVVLTQPELTALMEEDLAGKAVTVLPSLPERPEGAVLYYGEEGLLECRSLPCDAVVTAIPKGFHAQALTNLWSGEGCVVYIPAGYDITPCVPLKSKTRLTFSHLALLEQAFGDGIYKESVEDLYRKHPGFFVNIYQNAPTAIPVHPECSSLTDFDRGVDEALTEYLSGFDGAEYISAYFEDLQRRPICYDQSQPQEGILVQAVRVSKSAGATVLQCPKGVTPRQLFRSEGRPGTALVSNFLFFMTGKLGVLYNDLRADRPREQADAASGHLDYMLQTEGKRAETFPLFGKTCIAMCRDGSFRVFNFYLGGGSVDISGQGYRWEADDVNSDNNIRVYTPLYSAADRDADRDAYIKPVGAGRVNVVMLRDKVTCIRRGDVLLPSVGVVLSLTEEAAAPLLAKCAPLEDGYFNVSGLVLTVRLDAPIDNWEQVQWVYGGGLTLMQNGVGLCDGDHMERWFDAEGWSTPLSRQTQESKLHVLAKHPRTAIGCAKNGDLLVLVYSGRTWRSTGADYSEMIAIARALYPDVHYLMNGDGGGSAMLGLVHEGEFMELSCPSTSSASCAGQVRPINTVFYIPISET